MYAVFVRFHLPYNTVNCRGAFIFYTICGYNYIYVCFVISYNITSDHKSLFPYPPLSGYASRTPQIDWLHEDIDWYGTLTGKEH